MIHNIITQLKLINVLQLLYYCSDIMCYKNIL